MGGDVESWVNSQTCLGHLVLFNRLLSRFSSEHIRLMFSI